MSFTTAITGTRITATPTTTVGGIDDRRSMSITRITPMTIAGARTTIITMETVGTRTTIGDWNRLDDR